MLWIAEPIPDTDDARNRSVRQHLTRRLLDDAVTYHDDCPNGTATISRASVTGSSRRSPTRPAPVPEIRSEGIAMVDERGDCPDVVMPDQGTDGHVTLLVAEHHASRLRAGVGVGAQHVVVPVAELQALVAELVRENASWWGRQSRTRRRGGPDRRDAGPVDRVGTGATRQWRRETLPAIARYRLDEPVPPVAPPALFDAAMTTETAP